MKQWRHLNEEEQMDYEDEEEEEDEKAIPTAKV